MIPEISIENHPLAARFNRLEPDQVFDAVEVGGRRASGRFMILNSYENRVYQLELEDESWVVGKFYRPGRWTRESILDEHRFIAEVAAAEIPVARPLELTASETIGEVDGILYALFERVGGRSPQELSDEQVEITGRLVARIHNIGAAGEAPHRLALTPTTYGRDNLHYLLENDLIDPSVRSNYAQTVEILLSRIEPLFLEVPVHRLHGDCHLGNLIWTPKGPTFLDFDDMVIGPAAQDVWMLVPSSDHEGKRQRELFIEAYRQFRPFSDSWLRLVEPLRALRYIHYTTWIARRWEDPSFKQTFTHFGEALYWEREVQDLREQIARIDNEIT
ncbi:MAG: serine/threonine protein kinase [Myxococcales bacterium]|nr:serine/threonine protein kinase [Myxococcales bacterium]